MPTTVTHREDCRLCQSKNVELVVPLKPVPLAEKYCSSPEAAKDVERFPIDLYMCKECGHVQLLDVIDSDTLWDDYTYFSGQTKGIVDHFREIASQIIKTYKVPEAGLVIDIGSNDGSLLRQFKDQGCKVLGIDPAREIAMKATEGGIPTLPELMSYEIAESIHEEHGSAAVVTAFNVFAHADNLGSMADSIKKMLASDGVFVFECQYLLDIIDKMLLGTIFHEHMSHHSVKPMMRFLNEHGLELIDVHRNSIQHGSIVGFAQHRNGPRNQTQEVADLLSLEESWKLDKTESVHKFGEKIDALRREISQLLEEIKQNGLSVAGYGAARSGPTIIAQFGLQDSIEYILDDHPMKTGKYTPGDGIEVISTKELYTRRPDYVFILAWIHAKKIIEGNKKFLENGGKFVVCFPELQIVDASSPYVGPKSECAVAN